MPIRLKNAPPAEPTPTFVDKLRMLGGGATRAVAGVLAAEGGPTGALISGTGETLAQLVEGSMGDDPKRFAARVGVEAGLGAIPFGALLKEGRVLSSALRGATHSAVGETAREAARGEELSPTRIGISAGTGGLVTGGLAKLLGVKKAVPSTTPEQFEVETTAVPGGRVLGDKKGTLDVVKPPSTTQVNRPVGRPAAPTTPAPADPRAAYWAKQGLNPPSAPGRMASPQGNLPFDAPEEAISGGRIPYTGSGAYPEGSVAKSQKREIEATHTMANKIRGKELRDEAAAAKQAEKETENQQKLGIIKKAIEEGKLEKGGVSVGESISAKTEEGGTIRKSTSYKAPDEEDADIDYGDGTGPAIVRKGGKQTEIIPQGKLRNTGWSVEQIEALAQKYENEGNPSVANRIRWDNGLPIKGNVVEPAQLPAGVNEEIPPATPPVVEGEIPPEISSTTRDTLGRLGYSEETINKMTPEQALHEMQEELKVNDDIARNAPVPITPEPPPTPKVRAARTVKKKVLTPNQQAAEEAYLALKAKIDAERVDAVQQAAANVPPPPTPPVPEVPSAPARLFKSPVDALGEAYRTAKTDPDVNPLAKRYLGSGLSHEAARAGLPSKRYAPDALNQFLEGDLSPEVSKALGRPPLKTEPSLKSARPLKEGELPPTSGNWVQDELNQVDALARAKGKADKGGGGGTTLGAGLGGLQDILGIARRNPEFTATLARTGVGALAGGVLGGQVDHPFIGALLGGAAGAMSGGSGDVMGRLSAIKDQLTNSGAQEAAQTVAEAAAHYQRMMLLTDPVGLPINAGLAPYGSAIMGAIEHGLSGNPEGWAALRALTPENWMRHAIPAWTEAGSLIGRAEGEAMDQAPTMFRKLGSFAGRTMTTGDVASRNILEEAGIPEEAARRFTLTNEPDLQLFRKFANLARGDKDITTPIIQIMSPFRRTPANVTEQGLQRIPGLGFLFHGEKQQDPLQQMLVQQGMGTVSGLGGYAVGSSTDPNEGRVGRRAVSNALGGYGLPFNIGYLAGQANRADRPGLGAAVAAFDESMPLPTTNTIRDWANFIGANGRIPRGVVPPTARDVFFPATNTSTGRVAPLSGFRIRVRNQ